MNRVLQKEAMMSGYQTECVRIARGKSIEKFEMMLSTEIY